MCVQCAHFRLSVGLCVCNLMKFKFFLSLFSFGRSSNSPSSILKLCLSFVLLLILNSDNFNQIFCTEHAFKMRIFLILFPPIETLTIDMCARVFLHTAQVFCHCYHCCCWSCFLFFIAYLAVCFFLLAGEKMRSGLFFSFPIDFDRCILCSFDNFQWS